MSAWFVLARLTDRTDVVDSAWGLGFVYVAWLSYLMNPRSGWKLLAAVFVSVWGMRLFVHLTSRSLKRSEDYRYVEFRKKWGGAYWGKAFVRIFLLQGLLLFLVSLATIAIMMTVSWAMTWLAVAGFVTWAIGIVYEAVGDWQLRQFMKSRKPGQIMAHGLWRYSRHPNYFGEVIAWWGAGLVALSFGQWWGLLGSLTITVLITKVSGIPPLEKHYAGNAAYEQYKARTSVLVPLPPRKTS
ncbi:MAG TPA: DUF1295 domain-containing protein, partial [Candidatus Saccharimonadales bacterium]|nr:DUF1295 domain-containing protein [Candidatus Saccharimonadales bacterium]